jgi:Tol biopolymer transport system component
MPYVKGETLRTKLDREKQLGIDEAVKITPEVADALDYAHRHGVIHRDIKPENILLHDGRPMVMDFGIALAVSAAAGGRMTETGLSVGTPHYMSPEQAAAERHITARSDIYSLGCVLYEMLAGEPPHTGASVQQILLRIAGEEAPPVSQVRRNVPPNVAAALAKALEKVPADRFETARAFAGALTNPAFTTASAVHAAPAALPRLRLATCSLGAACVVLAGLATWGWLRPGPPQPVKQFSTSLRTQWEYLSITTAISPDGSEIVYADSTIDQLFLKRGTDLEPHPLPGTEGGLGPFFSPDGAWIGFFANGRLLKMPSAGGATTLLADSAGTPFPQGAWLDDGTIVYQGPNNQLRRVSTGGGPAQVLTRRSELRPWTDWPRALPDSRGVLFTRCSGRCDSTGVYVYDLRRDTVRLLYDGAVGAGYAPPGYVLYLTRDGRLLAAPWDNDRLAPTGPAVPVLEGIHSPNFVMSPSGTALYVLGAGSVFEDQSAPNAEAIWVSRTGRVEPVDPAWRFNTGTTNWGLSLSPDGHRLAIRLHTEAGQNIWIKQLPAGPLSRLTFYRDEDRAPRWSPDGKLVTFLSARPVGADTGQQMGTVWNRAADGTGEPRLVWGKGPESWTQGFWSPDGKWLILRGAGPANLWGGRDIYIVQPGTDSVARPLLATTDYDEQGPAISPDSRWIAYVSNETGTDEVFVRPFPGIDRGKWQISRGAVASAPLWAHHGHELFYAARDTMMWVTITPGPPFQAGEPRPLFIFPDGVGTGVVAGDMDISPDDRRFIMVRRLPAPPKLLQLVMVENLMAAVKAKVEH